MLIKPMVLMIYVFFFLKNKKKIPVYVNKSTKNYLNKSFSYCFKNYKDYPATLKFLEIKNRINFGKTLYPPFAIME